VSTTVAELLAELGGVARFGILSAKVGRETLEASVASGDVVRDARGVYALPEAEEATRVAVRLGGVLSLTSAALRHGWALKSLPDKPHVTVSRGRKLGSRSRLAHVHWADLDPDDVCDGVVVPELALAQCLRLLPLDEALAVADSALRESGCAQLLARVAEEARGPGSRQVRAVAARASALASGPFESVGRSLCDEVPGLHVEPQVQIGAARADLVDRRLRIVVECDSFAWHGTRGALVSDARRYNEMVVDGWTEIRLTYEDVMHHPARVRAVLAEAVALAELLAQRLPDGPRAA